MHAKSEYYNTPAFSNVAINMNEEEAEDYYTVDGMCFAKVNIIINNLNLILLIKPIY